MRIRDVRHFIEEVYVPEVTVEEGVDIPDLSVRVAAKVRTFLALAGTLVTVLGSLEVLGISIIRWITVLGPAICGN
jgi:hypothetical protein